VTTFGLVHGAWHTGWCWARVGDELAARGHRAVAMDLPGADKAAGCREYAAAVVAALDGAGDDVVLVGHSLGGLTIPVVATMRPVRHLVFVNAMLPRVGASIDDQLADEPEMVRPGLGAGQVRHDDGATSWRPEAAVCVLYPDAPPALARAAAARLRRQYWRPTRETTPLTEWPDSPVTSVISAGDAVIDPGWSHRVGRDRLRARIVDLPGDHSPFLARPGELADILARV
jgi:pimeloyl-ACP methyl ester carboxylesterase